MFEQLVQNVLDQARLVAQAPLAFAAGVLLLGAIIWSALRWRYAKMIDHRNGIIALYKARLNGASPDQAKARMDSRTRIMNYTFAMAIARAHELGHRVERRLRDKFPGLTDVVVHVEPALESERARIREGGGLRADG
jgi:hypothetical protein